MRTQILILTSAVLLSIMASVGLTWKFFDTKIELLQTSHDLVIKTLESESLKTELELTELQKDFEKRLSERKIELEQDYRKNVQGIRDSINVLDGIRLRDPNRDKGGNSTPARDSGTTQSCEGDTGELSEATSRFLLNLAASADETREKLILCNQFIDEVRKENRDLIERTKEKKE